MRNIQRLLEEATLRGEPDPYAYVARQLGMSRDATRNYVLAYLYGLSSKHRQKASQNELPSNDLLAPNSRLGKQSRKRNRTPEPRS